MNNSLRLTVIILLLAVSNLSAATHYVSLESPNPTPPYTNWQSAARVIQDAVEAAAAGDQIIVTNGTYATGGRAVGTNVLVNRVAVDKPLAVRSVNGPQFTEIQGYQVPATINGEGAIRCVYLASGASLFGFTLTNGATRQWTSNNRDQSGGGVWCDSPGVVVSNCVMAGNACYSGAGGAFGGTLNDCVLASNLGNGASGSTLNNCVLSNNLGSGASSSTLNNCILIGNSGGQGGGASYCTLTNCTLTGNTTYNQGGGANSCTLYNCTLNGNSGYQGGGASASTLYNCTLTGDSAASEGGGVAGCTLNNCTLIANSANEGGGADYCTLANCTLTGNSASDGGGANACNLNDCIVYYNTATRNANGANYSGGTLNYCCTTPMPPNGQGNITLDPQLASASHLSADSPCMGAGSAAYATGTDIDGEAWASPPSIGCDEYYAGAVTGPLSVGLVASYTNVAAGYSVSLMAVIAGRTTASMSDFGDGVIVSNQPYASHAWTGVGDYTVALRAFNDSHPDGVSASVTIHVVAQPVHYVAATSTAAQPPYTNWATAAATIQDAVDAATMTGALVLVTNGTYATGGRPEHGATGNRVAVDKPLVLRSVNGPQFTVIQGHQVPGTTNGDGAFRCVYLTNGASLSGFTLTQGATRGNAGEVWERSGGGIWCEPLSAVVSNCILAGNSADYAGGGAYQGTLNNCRFAGNTGGGAVHATLSNCTLTGNNGGGAYSSSLNNCVLTANSGYGASSSTLNNCTLTGNPGVGASGATLYNSTLTCNFSGGAAGSTLYNCIIYYNAASVGANYDVSSALNYCCTTPLPASGTGNFSLDPQLASASHLSAASPCRGAGTAAYASGTDIDGEAWANAPSIGCDEYHAGAVTGPLSVGILAGFTNVAVGYPLALTVMIDGRTVASMWDFGDGLVVSNRPYATHAWSTAGDYAVVLRAYNENHPDGLTATVTVHVTATVHYVLAENPNPVAPYTNWATAAQTIQDAVDVDVMPGAIVLVGDGQYSTGGRAVGNSSLVNRVAITKPLAVRSVNGPQFTTILGYQLPTIANGPGAIRCVYLTNGASLSGFTLSGGATLTNDSQYLDLYGGGVRCDSTYAIITNCVLSGNSAYNGGGGASEGMLFNCKVTGNWTPGFGGGASASTLNGCTISGNSANGGGGVVGGTLYNCVVTGNSANGFNGYGGGAQYSALTNCTISGNLALSGGGGVFGGTLHNCAVSGNHTYNGPGGGATSMFGECTLYNCTLNNNSASWGGGGAAACLLYNCALSGNSASYGGGAAGGTLYNCTVSGNSADYGGGVSANFGIYPSTLYNCIVYCNTAQNGTNYGTNCSLTYCGTTPLPTSGVGNITNAPLFTDTNGLSNLRLQSNSPCINAGNNAYVTCATDLDGNPRIVSGTVDIGAYEFQGTGSRISYAWLQQYGLPTDGSVDYADPDHDGMNNWQEWVCGTDPANRLSALRLLSPSLTSTNVTVTWQSVAGVNYFVERSANLAAPFTLSATNILGQAGTTSYADTNAAGGGPFFYRVGLN